MSADDDDDRLHLFPSPSSTSTSSLSAKRSKHHHRKALVLRQTLLKRLLSNGLKVVLLAVLALGITLTVITVHG